MAHHQHTAGAEVHEHDRGLSHDLPTLLSRRRALRILGGAGLVAVVAGCATDAGTSSSATTTSATTTAAAGPGGGPGGGAPPADSGSTVAVAEGEIPEETAGPYPGDGSNGVNVLTESGIVRSDITTSFGTGSAVAAGVPLTIDLTLLDVSGGGTALAGAAVYLWHCNSSGEYSMYDAEIVDENYLRGVQETDAAGQVRFTSVYPAAYDGRWPHIHVEVYPSLADATSASGKLRTSQIALPAEASAAVYATAGYEASVANMARTSLETDMVFSDGYSLQLAAVTGSVTGGMTATLTIPV